MSGIGAQAWPRGVNVPLMYGAIGPLPEHPFDPSGIAGLVTWVKADALTGLSDGDAGPTTYTDLSGNGNHFVAGGSPGIYKTGQTPTSGPVLRHNPSYGAYASTGAVSAMSGTTSGELFVVLRSDSSANPFNGCPYQVGAQAGTWTQFGGVSDGSFASGGVAFPSVSSPDDTWHLVDVYNAGSSTEFLVENVNKNSRSTTYTAPSYVYLGFGQSVGGWKGDTAEFLLFDHALSSDDRGNIVAYLAARHGITV